MWCCQNISLFFHLTLHCLDLILPFTIYPPFLNAKNGGQFKAYLALPGANFYPYTNVFWCFDVQILLNRHVFISKHRLDIFTILLWAVMNWITLHDPDFVLQSPAPAPFVKEMTDAGQFYTNRVLKDWKDKSKSHVEWTKAWLQTLQVPVAKNRNKMTF